MEFEEKKKGFSVDKLGKDLKRKLPLEFFFTIIRAFNPNAYEELSTRTLKNVFSYFFSILFLSYIIMIIVGLPVMVNIESQIEQEFAKFDEFSVDLNVSMSEPIYISQLGIGIDTINEKNLSNENLLITENRVQSKPLICVFKPFCWFNKNVNSINSDEYKNLVDKSSDITSWISILVLFLLPWILINLLFVLFAKYILTAFVFGAIGFLFARIINRKIKFSKIFKIAVYALTVHIVVSTINIPLGINVLYLPLAISLLYFVIGLILASERGFKK